ncbi:hypothetical protein HAT2_00342 [Candidatus Similichlamydia laticola]|uniref:Carbohydrate kinase PfkB domain-containing protein n=2 Tax=Candidatus Similichlamydia laticola TaxID=2170265 RepID=A0A369KAB7_9BACT|nr:hypothetical protein HAT2_00342 [Candidatus Similichlamydia laticola]
MRRFVSVPDFFWENFIGQGMHMTATHLAYLSIIGFFLPVCNSFVFMPKQEQEKFLEQSLVGSDPFHLRSFYKLSSSEFDTIVQKLEERGLLTPFSTGGIVLNTLQHLAQAGANIDIGTSHGTGEKYSILDEIYTKLFRKKFLEESFLQPPRLIYLYEYNDHDPTVIFTTDYTGGLSDNFIEKIPSFAWYHLVLIDGHILPFPSSIEIIKQACEDNTPVAVNCGKHNFLKIHKQEYLSLLPMISMFTCNLEEAQILTDLSDVRNCAIALQKRMKPGASVLVTDASRDFCIAKPDTVTVYSPPIFPENKIIHSMGCGDAAAAGFFLGNLLQLPDPIQASLIMKMGCSILESPSTLVPEEKIRSILTRHKVLPTPKK